MSMTKAYLLFSGAHFLIFYFFKLVCIQLEVSFPFSLVYCFVFVTFFFSIINCFFLSLLTPASNSSVMLQRVHLEIQVGEHTNNYPEIAAKDKLTELQLRVRQLLDQVEQIQKEQSYQRVSSEKQNKKNVLRCLPELLKP